MPGASRTSGTGRLRAVVTQSLICAVFATYPVVVWLGLAHESPRAVALVLLCIVLPISVLLWRRAGDSALRWLLLGPVVTVLGLAAAAVFDSTKWLFVEPVAINAGLLVVFGATLRPGAMPMIERFARLQESSLSPAQIAWCRLWTIIWSAFFVANGTAAAVLAVAAPVAWWAWYNSVLAYVIMGVLFASEWTIRRWRFHRG
jgi:uncharacterized membrane protein